MTKLELGRAKRLQSVEEMKLVKYGKIQVLGMVETEPGRGNKLTVSCICDCGNLLIVKANDLKFGKQKSCGCLARDKMEIGLKIGQQFHYLTVLEFSEMRNKQSYYKFTCVCGNIIDARFRDVKSGNKKSCGCHRRKPVDNTPKKFIRNPDLTGKEYHFGTVLDKDSKSKWNILCKCGNIFRCSQGRIINEEDRKELAGCGDCYYKNLKIKSKLRVEGEIYNKLTIIQVIDTGLELSKSKCFCHCECGNFCSANYSNIKYGDTTSCGCYKKIVASKSLSSFLTKQIGPLNRRYNPNLTDYERENIRGEWISGRLSFKVFEMDQFRCVKCNCTSTSGNKFNAHHCDSWTICNKKDGSRFDKSRRFDIYSNCITLCENCHKEFNKTYGLGYTTMEQTIEFLGFIPYRFLFDPIHLGM